MRNIVLIQSTFRAWSNRTSEIAGRVAASIQPPLCHARKTAARRLPFEDGRWLALHPHAPPANVQAKHSAQMIAFLIRNRGRLDNDVVLKKWKHLDRTSMRLAIYPRDSEANDGVIGSRTRN